MGRTKNTPGVQKYYQTLQKIFQLQSEILTGVLPHSGERGENDEERFRDFLRRVVPKKFSVGTGFLVCSDPDIPASSQTDVVLYDEIHNSPLHQELSAYIFPVEIVYGVIEVKGLLQKKDLKKVCEDIQKVRELAQHRWYLEYTNEPKTSEVPEKRIVGKREFQIKAPPPRAFLFAYDKKGWRTIDDLANNLKEVMTETPAHIHGLAVLSKDWYISQEAHAEEGVNFDVFRGDALLKFVSNLIHDVASMRMNQMSIDRYLGENHGA